MCFSTLPRGFSLSLTFGRLACVLMPLVLTAINVRFSTSASEIWNLRQKLERLVEIVRQSGRVYAVADSIGAGTNHILQLAYITYRYIYPRFDIKPVSSTSAGNPRGAPRICSWHDAFLQSPRAYLLISISLDYYLSVGRLPINNVLPEIVHHIPYFGDEIRLPWVDKTPENTDGEEREQQDETTSSNGSIFISLIQSNKIISDSSLENSVGMSHEGINQDHGDESNVNGYNLLDGDQINIDYMSLDSTVVCSEDTQLSQSRNSQEIATVP